jgi:hypothetical protein
MKNHDKTMIIRMPSRLLDFIQAKADEIDIDRSKLMRYLILKSFENELRQDTGSKRPFRSIVPLKKIGTTR